MEDQKKFVVNLEHFNNEYIFEQVGRIWGKPDLKNICFDGSYQFNILFFKLF